MYEVILDNATGIMDFRFESLTDAQKFCLLFAKSNPHHGDRRSYRIYKNNKMIDHEEFA